MPDKGANDDWDTDKDKKIIFTYAADPITRKKEYRFVGVFQFKQREYDAACKKEKSIYERVCDSFEIISS